MEKHGIKKGDKFIMPSWYDCTKTNGATGYSFGGLDKDGVEVKAVSISHNTIAVSPTSYEERSFTYNMLVSELIPIGGKEEYSLTF